MQFLAPSLRWSALLAQEGGAGQGGAGLGGAGLGGAGQGGPLDFLFGNMMIPLAITMLLMYLLLMRPEQKKRKEMERLLKAIKKNDHVVTVGGIYGTVVNAVPESKFVTLRVDDSTGAKLKVLRSAISHVGATDEAEADGKSGE